MTKVILVAVAIILAPLVLWFDVYLAFNFAGWISETFGDNGNGGPAMLGFFAFFVLAGSQAFAAGWLVNYND